MKTLILLLLIFVPAICLSFADEKKTSEDDLDDKTIDAQLEELRQIFSRARLHKIHTTTEPPAGIREITPALMETIIAAAMQNHMLDYMMEEADEKIKREVRISTVIICGFIGICILVIAAVILCYKRLAEYKRSKEPKDIDIEAQQPATAVERSTPF